MRYHGVLASASSLRDFVVPCGVRKRREKPTKNYCWAELMKRAFEIDVLVCPDCSGAMRFIASIIQRDAIRAILGSMGLPADSPDLVPARPLPQLDFEFTVHGGWEAA